MKKKLVMLLLTAVLAVPVMPVPSVYAPIAAEASVESAVDIGISSDRYKFEVPANGDTVTYGLTAEGNKGITIGNLYTDIPTENQDGRLIITLTDKEGNIFLNYETLPGSNFQPITIVPAVDTKYYLNIKLKNPDVVSGDVSVSFDLYEAAKEGFGIANSTFDTAKEIDINQSLYLSGYITNTPNAAFGDKYYATFTPDKNMSIGIGGGSLSDYGLEGGEFKLYEGSDCILTSSGPQQEVDVKAGTKYYIEVYNSLGNDGAVELWTSIQQASSSETETTTDTETTVTKKSQKVTIKNKNAKKTFTSDQFKAGKQTVQIKASAKTALSYKITKGSKYVSVNKKGLVTVKRWTPQGTYKVKVSAEATDTYKAASATFEIQVKAPKKAAMSK